MIVMPLRFCFRLLYWTIYPLCTKTRSSTSAAAVGKTLGEIIILTGVDLRVAN